MLYTLKIKRDDMETTSSFQSSWTLAEALIHDIANHLNVGRTAWLRGDLEKYYWEFEVIIRILHGMLDAKEKELAKEMENKITLYLPVKDRSNHDKLCPLLKQYDGMVMDCIHKHKLDVPPKKDYTNLGS